MASTTLPFRGTLPARRNQIGGCISGPVSLPREGPFLVSVQQDPRPSDATRNSMLTSALLAVSSLRVTQQQGLFPHTTATTSGAAEASTPVAVMLVGAANDMNISDMQRLAEFVVEPMAPAEVFILIKAIHHNRSWYSPEDTEQLRRNVQQYLRPTSSSIEAADLPLERFRNASNATTDCLYPMSGRQYVLESERRTLQSRFAYWWGALDLAWDLVAERERTRGSVFETIVFVRPDLNFLGPIRRPEDVQRGVWYSPVEPPDGFWILPRTAASRAMKTASLMVRAWEAHESYAVLLMTASPC